MLAFLGGGVALNQDQNTSLTPIAVKEGIGNSLPRIDLVDFETTPETPYLNVDGPQLGETTTDVVEGNPKILLLGGTIAKLPGLANNTTDKIFGYQLDSNYKISSPVPEIIKVVPDEFWPADANLIADLNFLQFGDGKLLVSALAMSRGGDKRKDCPGKAVQWFVTQADVNDPLNPKVLYESNPNGDCLKDSPDKPAIALGENGGFVAVVDIRNKPGLYQTITYRGPDGVQKIADYHDSLDRRMIHPAVNYIGDNRYLIFSKGISKDSSRLQQKNVKLYYRIFDAATGKTSNETEIVSENGENLLASFLGASSFRYLETAYGCLQAGGTKDYSTVVMSYLEKENAEQNRFTTLIAIVHNKTGKAIVKKLPLPFLNPSVQTLGDEIFIVGDANYSESKVGMATIGNFNDVAIKIDPSTGSIVDIFNFRQYQAVIEYNDPGMNFNVRTPRSDYAIGKLLRVNGKLYLFSYQSNVWHARNLGYKADAILNVPGVGIDTVYTR